MLFLSLVADAVLLPFATPSQQIAVEWLRQGSSRGIYTYIYIYLFLSNE